MYDPAKKAERCAVLSSCCGVTGEAALTDSAVILLFAASLGSGDALGLFSMAVLPLLNGLLILPWATLSIRFGSRSLVLGANMLALAGYFAAAAAPWAGKYAPWVLIGGILLFSICQSGFVAGWFPFIDGFLPPERRSLFLGRMRFFHQLSAVAFLWAASRFVGENPAVWTLQIVLFVSGVIFAGRILFIKLIPVFPEKERKTISLKHGLQKAFRNRPLKLFSLYTFFLNFSVFAVTGVILLELKSRCNVPENKIMLISGVIITGLATGYAVAPRLEKYMSKHSVLLLNHILAFLSLVMLLLIRPGSGLSIGVVTVLLMIINFVIGAVSVTGASVMMSLANADNKSIAMAFWGCFYAFGSGISRLISSLFLRQADDVSKGFFLIFPATAVAALFFLLKSRKAADKKT